MNLERVTITGADDSVQPIDLVLLSRQFPFLEIGILFGSRAGVQRFPSEAWVERLAELAAIHPSLQLSAHLCGRRVRSLLNGGFDFAREPFYAAFSRLQINLRGEGQLDGQCYPLRFALGANAEDKEVILQMNGANDWLLGALLAYVPNVAPLFDRSGGTGTLPNDWPAPIGSWCGYAGGLTPDNLHNELRRIAAVAGDCRVWTDLESGVRAADGTFDMAKARRVLEAARPWVSQGAEMARA